MDRNYPGPCGDCCSCPNPTLMVSIISASKSKCGATDITQPNKVFLRSVTVLTDSGSSSTNSCSASGTSTSTITYDRSSCAETQTCSGSSEISQAGESKTWTLTDCSWVWTSSLGETFYSGAGAMPDADCGISNYVSETTYSNEFTTSELEADTVAALPSTWPSFSAAAFGSPLASAELSSTEASYMIEQGQYYFAHPAPSFGAYELTWVERLTPDGGGTPVDMARTYTWDGSIPSGYNPSESTTWPKSGTFTVTQPASNGTVTIANLKLICAGTTTQLVP